MLRLCLGPLLGLQTAQLQCNVSANQVVDVSRYPRRRRLWMAESPVDVNACLALDAGVVGFRPFPM